MDTPTRAAAIRDEIVLALADSDVVVEEVTIQPAGRRRLVRVTVARDVSALLTAEADPASLVHPLSLDEVATASRAVESVLDAGDLLGAAPYTLEVSSPGAEQPLRTPAQFRRNVGRLLALSYTGGGTTEARLSAVTPDGVHLADTPGDGVVPFSAVSQAKVQIEFTRPTAGEDD